MGRYGFTSDERIWVDAIYHEVYPHIRPIGLYTHFHTAGKRWQVLQQVNRFQWTLERLRLHGDDPGMIHYCNSIAFWKYPKYHENAVRLGSAILGRVYYGRKAGLRRVGWVEAPIQEVKHLYRDSNVGYGNACKVSRGHDLAVVGVGYFHGFGVEQGL